MDGLSNDLSIFDFLLQGVTKVRLEFVFVIFSGSETRTEELLGTRILKIGLEIAEIIEVKVGTHHLEIYILILQ